jgi:peptide/nickel transport system substrate-binding protein
MAWFDKPLHNTIKFKGGNKMFLKARSKKHLLWIVFIAALVVFPIMPATVVPVYAAEKAEEEENVFVYGIMGPIQWNPLTMFSSLFPRGIYWTTLFRYDENYDYVPHMAKSAVKIDDFTWEVKLRPDLKWHDGEQITSEDFKFAFDIAMNYSVTSSRWTSAVESVEVVDDLTFHVKHKTKVPFASWLGGNGLCVPKHDWEARGAVGEDAATFDNIPPIGNGPFKLVDWKAGEWFEFEAFDDYFQGRPAIDRLIIGELDAIGEGMPPKAAKELAKIPGVEISITPSNLWVDMYFNLNKDSLAHPALQDLNVRKALLMATDKNYLNDILHPDYTVGFSFIPPFRATYYAKEHLNIYPEFNIAKANKILDDAGYKMGSKGIRVGPDGRPLLFRLMVVKDYADEIRGAEIIKNWWNQIGVDIEVTLAEAGTGWETVVTPPYDWDLQTHAWFCFDPVSVWWPFTSEGIPAKWSSSGYSNPEYDALFQKLLNTTTEKDMIAVIKELQVHTVENAIELTLYFGANASAWWANKWVLHDKAKELGGIFYYSLNHQPFSYVEPVE